MDASRYTPASTYVELAPTVVDGTAASFKPRAGARIVDWILHTVWSGVGGAVGGMAGALMFGAPAEKGEPAATVLFTISAVITLAGYHVLSEWVSGATPGKALVGLRVIRDDFEHPSFGQAFKRQLAYVADSLFFGTVGHFYMRQGSLEQRLGDRWAKTYVVRVPAMPPQYLRHSSRIGSLVSSGGLTVGITAITAILARLVTG